MLDNWGVPGLDDIFLVSCNDLTIYPIVLQIILQIITPQMVKRGKVPKTRISFCNKHSTVLEQAKI